MILSFETAEVPNLLVSLDTVSWYQVVGGAGIIVRTGYKVNFKVNTDRICRLTIHSENKNYAIISAYAPTLPVCEKKPEERKKFYKDLDCVINEISKRTIIFIAGDFNAQTGSAHETHPHIVGKHGKGILNSNGKHLIDMANRHKLVLTNTTFEHKMAHRTTWQTPHRNNKQIRNQIDYILVKEEHKNFITNSRSYGGTTTSSDHNIVIANTNIKL